MKKTRVVPVAVAVAALGAAMLVGCSGNIASNSQSAASPSAASSAASTTASSPSAAASSLLDLDGVQLTKLEIVMVGETPNFQPTFANNTSQDKEIDLSKFKVTKEDGTEVDFALGKKTIAANTPRSQNTMTAKANSLKVGDKVSVSYDGHDLGEYEVGEF